MRLFKNSLFGALLAACLFVALPGIAEGIEALLPVGGCADCCPDDTNEAECGPFCDECFCCASTPSAVLLPGLQPGPSTRIEPAGPVDPAQALPALPEVVYHPPRS